MSPLRSGVEPVPPRMAVAAIAVFAAALLAGGCSSRPDGTTSFIWSNDRQPYHVAAAVPVPVEIEDDGREGQVPPPRAIRREPDDPREPYSRNYGKVAAPPAPTTPAARAAAPAPAPAPDGSRQAARADEPSPVLRRKLASALPEE